MTSFFDYLFTKYPVKTRRVLEILPGTLAWILILSPVWGSFFVPAVLAYFILFFDVWWFYRSFALVVNAYQSEKIISKTEKVNWAEKVQALPDANTVQHVLIILNYKETAEKVGKTLDVLRHQNLPLKQLHIVLAMEEREKEAKERAHILTHEFKDVFGSIFATFHPDVVGEIKGKSSNEAYAGRMAYQKLFIDEGYDVNFATVTSVDADAIFDKQYFSNLTYLFLTDTARYNKFWQSAIVFYNNLWKVPSPIRIISFFGGLWRICLLVQKDKLLPHATYSLSFKLLKDIDFWDVDVIPEDYRIFFKAFYLKKGQIWVEPIFLKTSLDAPESKGYFNSLKNKYNQELRWSWGVSDQPVFIKWWLTVPDVPFWRKTGLLFTVLLDHVLWPVNWFIITVAANVMPFINPVYSRTSLGYTLPHLAGFILTLGLLAIVAMIIIDYRSRPKNFHLPWWKHILFPFEFILMPVIGFFLSALPALISHTKLMMGKRMEYKVTEKI